ncbi:MAG: O-antigen ligase family protein [Chloroflexi bacterium]|nr:O-antigen ligase family protein [Chloroflexota bacterium]
MLGGRIASALQYPNSLAAYLTASVLLGHVLGAAEERVWLRLPFILGSALSLLVLVFTYSRGAWLLYPVGVLGLVIFSPHPFRSRVVLSAMLTAVAVGASAALFSAGLFRSASGIVWTATVITIGMALAGGIGQAAVLGLGRRYRIGITVALIVAGLAAAPLLTSKLPSDIMRRMTTISLDQRSAIERIQFTRDALRIALDHPLTGTGGGGFAATYQAYQSFGYTSTQVHNNFAQTLVETGVLGLAAFLAIWVTALLSYAKHFTSAGSNTRLQVSGALIAAVALGFHSLFDFDLSLSAVSLVLWGLWAVVAGIEPRPITRPARLNRGRIITSPSRAVVFILAGATVGVFATRLLAGVRIGEAAARQLQQGNLAAAQAGFERAATYDPFTASFQADLGQTQELMAGAENHQALMQSARIHFENAMRLESTNPNFEAAYGAFALRNGMIDEGLRAFERAVTLQPSLASRYENLAQAYVLVGRLYLEQGQKAQAEQVLQRVSSVAQSLAQRHLKTPAFAVPSEITPATTPLLALFQGEALALLGDTSLAQESLVTASQSPNTAAEAKLWLGMLAEKRGNAASGKTLLEQAYAANGRLRDEHAKLIPLLRR